MGRDPGDLQLRGLVEECRTTLLGITNPLVKVVAAVLDAHGRTYTAVQVRSANCNHCSVCAEAIAIGMALTAGSHDLVACVAVARERQTTAVWSPCGSCRELLRDHDIGHVIVAEGPDLITAVPATDLLPWP